MGPSAGCRDHNSHNSTAAIDPLSVFLFGILGIGDGPSELGKSMREIWKLGKVELCLTLKVLKHKTLQN